LHRRRRRCSLASFFIRARRALHTLLSFRPALYVCVCLYANRRGADEGNFAASLLKIAPTEMRQNVHLQ
jgi:hypothetical protein